MPRPSTLLVLLAAPAFLVACDAGKSTLFSAKPGECYSVVGGRDSMGVPKAAKIPCASQTAALTCPPPAAVASCPGAQTQTSSHKQAGRKLFSRKVFAHAGRRQASSSASYARYDDGVAQSGQVVQSLGIEYARVDSDLLGGAQASAGGYGYAHSFDREEQGYREERREEHYAPPPPPPPPPPLIQGRAKTKVERSYSYGESASYSASSESSSAYGGRVTRGCDCDGPGGRGAGPHSSIDAYGFLTWPGKTPG